MVVVVVMIRDGGIGWYDRIGKAGILHGALAVYVALALRYPLLRLL